MAAGCGASGCCWSWRSQWGRAGEYAAAFKRFPDIHVTIEDIIAEGDKVAVRNTWRWAYLQAPHPVERTEPLVL
jgi:hypothetical protein